MNNKVGVKNEVKKYVKENQLCSIETLLKKDLPFSLMPLFDKYFGGIDMEGISTEYYIKTYKNFLTELRNLFNVEEAKKLGKTK